MFSKLENVERKFQEITDRLNAPGLDVREMTKLAKEHASLQEVVKTYQDYRQAEKNLHDNKALILTESDAGMRELIKQDIAELESTIHTFAEKLKILLLPKDPRDDKNTILEIRAGTGGEEAALFAATLLRMYSRFAETKGWQVELLSENETGKGGFKEVILLISGDRVYSQLKFEGGIHRVQRVPETEASGRVHTSAVTVAVMPEVDDIEIKIPDNDVRVDVFRAGGHGGQSVNTTDSAVRITHLPSGITVSIQNERSQLQNKATAMKILKSRLTKLKEEQHQEDLAKLKGPNQSAEWGNQIRNYVLHPYTLVKDQRTGKETGDVKRFLEGEIELI